MLDRFRHWWHGAERKQSGAMRSIMLLYTPGQPVWTSDNYELLANEGYCQNIWAYVCIGVLMRAVGQLRWIVTETGAGQNGAAMEMPDHALALLMRRPNPTQGGARFWGEAVGYLQISGNDYIERVGPGVSGLGTPRELYNLRPDRVTVVPGSRVGMVDSYQYRTVGQPETFDVRKVLHLRTFHPCGQGDLYGLGAVRAASRSIDQNNESRKWNVSLLQNGARPSLAFSFQGNLEDKQYNRFQKLMESSDTGPLNAGRPITLEGGGKVEVFSKTPLEMDWLQGMIQSGMETAAAFGVPAEIVGLKEATYENRLEARRALYTNTVLPLGDWLRDELNNWLVPLFDDSGRTSLDYDRDAIDALQEDRDKLWSRIGRAWWITIDEARAATGYDSDPDKGGLYQWEAKPAKISSGDASPSQAAVKARLIAYERKDAAGAVRLQREALFPGAVADVSDLFDLEMQDLIVEFDDDSEALDPDDVKTRIDAKLQEKRTRWEALLLLLLLRGGEPSAARTYQDISSLAPGIAVPGSPASWLGAMKAQANTQIQAMVTGILETSRKALSRLVDALATIETLTHAALVDGIRKVYSIFETRRAVVIGEDAVTTGTNLGPQVVAEVASKPAPDGTPGLVLVKTWHNPEDDRTRILQRSGFDHMEPSVEEQTVPSSVLFHIPAADAPGGYEELDFPGDTSHGASLGNVINCRCWLTYELA